MPNHSIDAKFFTISLKFVTMIKIQLVGRQAPIPCRTRTAGSWRVGLESAGLGRTPWRSSQITAVSFFRGGLQLFIFFGLGVKLG